MSLFAQGKFTTQPNVTHHRPSKVLGNDPLVQLGEGGQKEIKDGVCATPSTACNCAEPAHRVWQPSWKRAEIWERIKASWWTRCQHQGLWALCWGTQRWPSPQLWTQHSSLLWVARSSQHTSHLGLLYCFSKTSAWDVAWSQTEEQRLCPLHLFASSCSTTAIKARLMDLMPDFSRDSLLEIPALLNAHSQEFHT